jgi:VanZ family protein
LTRLLRWVPPLLWMGAIYLLSSDLGSEAHTSPFILPILKLLFPGLSPDTYELLHTFIRKLGHLTEYAVLAILWARALAGPAARWRMPHIAGALTIAVLWAMGDEWHQTFVPGRTPSVVDVGIDALGALLGSTAGRVARERWNVRRLAR